jgi:iron complex transport system substrate-binding protein
VKIVTLEPYAIDILTRISSGNDLECLTGPVTTAPASQHSMAGSVSDASRFVQGFSRFSFNLDSLVALKPDILLGWVGHPDPEEFLNWADKYLSTLVGKDVRLFNLAVNSLEQIYAVIEELGGLVGERIRARELATRIRGQLMAWGDSFFNRIRGKQVVVISEISPITVAVRWLPDLIRLLGGKAIELHNSSHPSGRGIWEDLVLKRPDVIVVALEGRPLSQSVKAWQILRDLPHWEELPAVKRGEVIFASGEELYHPGPRFLKGVAVLVSSMAGLDSGFITERDEYLKLRYLELHRHKFL